jgi:hypothetical protein
MLHQVSQRFENQNILFVFRLILQVFDRISEWPYSFFAGFRRNFAAYPAYCVFQNGSYSRGVASRQVGNVCFTNFTPRPDTPFKTFHEEIGAFV